LEKLVFNHARRFFIILVGKFSNDEDEIRQRGFSLIELAIVVAIIGVVALVALPNMIGWRAERKLEGAARNCMADMQLAKLTAIREGEGVAILFIPPNKYKIFLDANNNGALDGGEKVIRDRTISSGVSITNITFPGNVTHFYSRGLPALAGIGRVVFTNSNGNSRTIFLNSVGRLRLQ